MTVLVLAVQRRPAYIYMMKKEGMTFAEQKPSEVNKLNHTMVDKGHGDDSEVIMNPKRLDRSDSRHPTVQEFLSTPPSRHIIFFQLGFDLAAGNAADPHQVQNSTQG